MRISPWLALTVCAAMLAGCGARAAQPTLHERVRRVVEAGVPGALALASTPEGTRVAVAGVARREPPKPLRLGDRFRVGSVTKTFVATVVLQLAPLGLRQTTFAPNSAAGVDVHGYRAPSHQGIVGHNLVDVSYLSASWQWSAGGVVSTAGDLARFFAALLRGRLLPARLLAEMRTPVAATRGRYGLGLAVFRTPCGRAWGHTGNVNGTVTAVWNTRDGSRQAVLMANAFPLSADADTGVRRALVAAFCRS